MDSRPSSTVPTELIPEEEEHKIEPSCENTLKETFKTMELVEFWLLYCIQIPPWVGIFNQLVARIGYPSYAFLGNKAMKTLISFSTSCFCEAGFELLAVIKSKYQTKIYLERELSVALSD